jgi:hypothetical protein
MPFYEHLDELGTANGNRQYAGLVGHCESQKKLQIAERKINDLQRLLTREDANFYKSKCQWLRNYKSRCKWFHPDFTGAALWAKKGIWEPQESESEK